MRRWASWRQNGVRRQTDMCRHLAITAVSCVGVGMSASQNMEQAMMSTNKGSPCLLFKTQLGRCTHIYLLILNRFPLQTTISGPQTFYPLIRLCFFPSSRPISLIACAQGVVIFLGVRRKWLAAGLCTAQSVTGARLCGERVNNGS